METLQCPDEPYTINRFICRARQSKGYEKCPFCPNQELVLADAPPPMAPLPATAAEPQEAIGYWPGQELEPREASEGFLGRALERLAPLRQGAVAAGLLGGGVMMQAQNTFGGLRSMARRVYDYF